MAVTKRRLLVLLAASAAGCVTYTPETPAERELRLRRERLERTIGEGGLFGAGMGAAAGALAGGVQGGFEGARIGRLGGSAAGAYIRMLQERYATREAVLDRVAADLRATNADLEASIAALRAATAERRAAAPDPDRDARVSAEATATVAAAERRGVFFAEARALLDARGFAVGSSAAGDEFTRLRDRITAMRRIAATLAPVG